MILKPIFPFSAVQGQSQLKLALILAAIDPSIDGVLISGPRGSAKSTIARAIADLLPAHQADSSTFVTLPLGASEEMLIGTLDLQQVLAEQKINFTPGLLSKAHQGVLYVDEVNLLPDNLVDLLLDVAASGQNIVERDGVSHQHEAQFLLIGTMNPDEGEIRPQLLDRFGLMVELDNQYSLEDRIQIVETRAAFDSNPTQFLGDYELAQQQLKQKIVEARLALKNIHSDKTIRHEIAQRCQQANVDGLRADIVWFKAATACAAWHQREQITLADIELVEPLVLAHRRQTISNSPSSPPTEPPFSRPNNTPQPEPDQSQNQETSDEQDWGSMRAEKQQSGEKLDIDFRQTINQTTTQKKQTLNQHSGSQDSHISNSGSQQTKQGLKSRKANWVATLAASLGDWPPRDIKFKTARKSGELLHLIIVDTSGSALRQALQSREKAVILSLAEKAYLAREQIAILGFGNNQVSTILAKIRAPKALRERLDNIEMGGGTPLREAILATQAYLRQLRQQSPNLMALLYLITDGRSKAQLADIKLNAPCLLIDTEKAIIKRGRGKQLAKQLQAEYLLLS